MAQRKHIFLCLPPNYSYIYLFPPLGTPCLTSFLKKQGYSVTQQDHNMAYFHYLQERMELPKDLKPHSDDVVKTLLNSLFENKANHHLYYAPLLPKQTDPFLPYEDTTNSSFYFTEQLLASEHLERYLEDEEENTFLQFYLQKRIANQILSGDFDLLGLSLISPAQVIPTLTLCNLIKGQKRDFPIILGGQWPSLFRQELAKWPKLKNWVDGVIFDEGETPLYEYLQALEGKQSLGEVPNLFFLEKGKVYFNRKRTEEDLNTLPAPDFDGMPLEDYLASRLNGSGANAVTYQTSRECYWNRCTYCVDLPFPKHTYREKRPDLVIQDIKELKAKYGAQELILSDLAMAPSYMRKFSKRLLEEGISIRWWTFSRLDGALNRELFDLAKKAGCYRISFGMESGNQRVCNFIDKGTKIETMSRVIKDCGSAGIKVTIQAMVGLPSETVEEALDTISFLLEHRRFIDTVCYNIYYLTPANYIYRDPQKHQVAIDEKTRVPFQFFLNFKHVSETGIERKKAKSLVAFFENRWGKSNKEETALPLDFKPGFARPDPKIISIQVGKEKGRLYCYPIPHTQNWLLFDEKKNQTLQWFDEPSLNYESSLQTVSVYSCP